MDFTAYYSSSAGNLYRLSNGQDSLLIECGVPVQKIKQALNFKLSEIRACLVTHSHQDHSRAAADLMRSGIECYMTRETAATIGVSGHRLHIIEPLNQFMIDSWICIAFPTEHDCGGSVGYLMASGGEKLLFATDTYFIRNRFRGLTTIAIECNYSKRTLSSNIDPAVKHRLLRSHMSLETLKNFLRANDMTRVRDIHLLHVSNDNGDEHLFKTEIERSTGKPVYVASKGKS